MEGMVCLDVSIPYGGDETVRENGGGRAMRVVHAGV